MSKISSRVRKKVISYTSIKEAFYNEDGAIDLASIMVGIIVIGLIGGVIAATVFAVIPWSQDNAAKQQLDSIHVAENAYFGLVSDPSRVLATGETRNSFTNSAGLEMAKLLITAPNYCVVAINSGQDYQAYSKSGSGKIFTAKNSDKKAVPVVTDIIGECSSLNPVGGFPPVPTVTPPASAGYTVIRYWDFEAEKTTNPSNGWISNTGYGTGAFINSAGGYNGSKGMVTTNDDGYTSGVFQNVSVPFKAGVNYKVTAWVKVNIISGGSFTDLYVANSNGINAGSTRVTSAQNGQWQKLTFTFGGKTGGGGSFYISESSAYGVRVSLAVDEILLEEQLP